MPRRIDKLLKLINKTSQVNVQLTDLQKIKKAINAYRVKDTAFNNALIAAKVQLPIKEDNSKDINAQKAMTMLKLFLADATNMTKQMSDLELLDLAKEKVNIE